jgi:hypothetical protein
MSTPDYYLLIEARLGGTTLRPGTSLFNKTDSATIAAINARYGTGVALWPGSDPIVAAAAAGVAKDRKNVSSDALAVELLAAAVLSVRGAALQELSVAIGFAALVAAGAVTHLDFPMGTGPLPAGARMVGRPSVEGWVGFDDATHAVDQLEVGTTAGGAQLGALVAVDVTTGAGFPKEFLAGGYTGFPLSGIQPIVRFSSAVNLSTLTAGAATVKLFYTLQP